MDMDKLLRQASLEVSLDESQDLLDIANALVEERGLRSPGPESATAAALQVFP